PSPGLAAVALARTTGSGLNPALAAQAWRLTVADVLAFPQAYPMYLMGMRAAGFPGLPWPILTLVAIPIPASGVRARLRIAAVKFALLVAVFAFLLFL
ncbi:MAG: hypothetical protein ACYDDF_14095, partial [Thermoplasmatota archaeon]